MADNAYKPKPVDLKSTVSKKTAQGPHRGGNKYEQITMGESGKFVIVAPPKFRERTGHTQKQNVTFNKPK